MIKKNGKIVYPKINSYDKIERTMAQLSLIIKNEYKYSDLTNEEIQTAESIPDWSWDFSKEEIEFLNMKNRNKVVDIKLNN